MGQALELQVQQPSMHKALWKGVKIFEQDPQAPASHYTSLLCPALCARHGDEAQDLAHSGGGVALFRLECGLQLCSLRTPSMQAWPLSSIAL